MDDDRPAGRNRKRRRKDPRRRRHSVDHDYANPSAVAAWANVGFHARARETGSDQHSAGPARWLGFGAIVLVCGSAGYAPGQGAAAKAWACSRAQTVKPRRAVWHHLLLHNREKPNRSNSRIDGGLLHIHEHIHQPRRKAKLQERKLQNMADSST